MKLFHRVCVGLLLLLPAACLWSQVDSTSATGNNSDANDNRMMTPPPVSGQSYPTSFGNTERSNLVRGGLAFTSAYTDNALDSVGGHPVSDVSYSVAPFIALDETTSRLHWVLNYAPGFTFYQRFNSRNETDQNSSIDLQYRLSPHVTFSATDGFHKTSNILNQPDLAGAAAVSGGTQEPNFSVIAPIADQLSNSGNVGLNYQFAVNGMLGASGTFFNLHYPNQAEVPGLFDSSSQGASVFYSLRVSKMNYIGVTYQYQRLVSYPTLGQSETQTHALFLFYTLYATSNFSISLFGGPQYSDTVQPPIGALIQSPEARAWTPAAGGSLSWQGRLTNVALSYSHIISGGGGLSEAVKMDSASASIRRQIAPRLSGSVAGMYAQNDLIGSAIAGMTNGHTLSGTASLQQGLGQHLSLQLGYTRLRQDYGGVAVLAGTPNTNRESVSVSYQFSRPLGR